LFPTLDRERRSQRLTAAPEGQNGPMIDPNLPILPADLPTVDEEHATPGDLLDRYARLLVEAVHEGGLSQDDLSGVRAAGARAATDGMSAGVAVDLYLSAAARVWRQVSVGGDPVSQAAALRLLNGVRSTIPVLVDGYQNAQRPLVRFEETVRREFVDDLLRGDADIAGLVQRAEPFGLDFSRAHQVVLAGLRDDQGVAEWDESVLERAVISRYGDRDVLVTTKGGYLVALVPAVTDMSDVDEAAVVLHEALSRSKRSKPWRVSVGRPYTGAYGIARSYEEAREAIILAERLHPQISVIRTRDLLIYRVLGRDRVAITDLVNSVLTPLTQARGGAEPLLDTLEGYFSTGEVATATARQLHLSVRTVTYRLSRIAKLTGHDPADPGQRFILQVAVLGARLLNWPTER
jgi:sugar diacid utilization regulator